MQKLHFCVAKGVNHIKNTNFTLASKLAIQMLGLPSQAALTKSVHFQTNIFENDKMFLTEANIYICTGNEDSVLFCPFTNLPLSA